MQLNGKVAIVTGAARGLGRAYSEALAAEGAAVVAAAARRGCSAGPAPRHEATVEGRVLRLGAQRAPARRTRTVAALLGRSEEAAEEPALSGRSPKPEFQSRR